jgi:hypothetical protein
MKKILYVLFGLVLVAAGYTLGWRHATKRTLQNQAFFLSTALQQEIREQENAAFRLYVDGPSEAAAWAYEQLVVTYARHEGVMRGWNTAVESDVPASMFAHLRLYTIYSGLNQSEKAQAHLAQATQLSGGRDLRELISMLDLLDRKQRS